MQSQPPNGAHTTPTRNKAELTYMNAVIIWIGRLSGIGVSVVIKRTDVAIAANSTQP